MHALGVPGRVVHDAAEVQDGCAGQVGIQGGYTRVGIQGCTTRVLPSHRARKTHDSGAGPGRPAGPGVGGHGSGRVSLQCSAAGTVEPTLRARSVPLQGPSLVLP